MYRIAATIAAAFAMLGCSTLHSFNQSARSPSGPPPSLKPGTVGCTLPPIGKGERECYYVPEIVEANGLAPYQFYVKGDYEVGWDHAFGDGHLVILVGEYADYPQVPLQTCIKKPVDISGNTSGSAEAVCTRVLKNGVIYLVKVWAGATPGTGYINADPEIKRIP